MRWFEISTSAFALSALFTFTAQGQLLDSAQLEQVPVHYSIADGLKNPDSVFVLVLRRNKLTEFPQEIFKFKNLNELDISRNKIVLIPRDIGTLTYLADFNISKNKLKTLPPDIGKLKDLKRLIIFQNNIAYLPSEIGGLESLEYLDMWGNEVETLPPEMGNLKNLQKLDMRVIEMSDTRQKEYHELMPNTNILFSNSCDCGG